MHWTWYTWRSLLQTPPPPRERALSRIRKSWVNKAGWHPSDGVPCPVSLLRQPLIMWRLLEQTTACMKLGFSPRWFHDLGSPFDYWIWHWDISDNCAHPLCFKGRSVAHWAEDRSPWTHIQVRTLHIRLVNKFKTKSMLFLYDPFILFFFIDFQEMKRQERAHFFSSKEQELILKLYDEEKEILTAKSNTTSASKLREEAWQRIADKINA